MQELQATLAEATISPNSRIGRVVLFAPPREFAPSPELPPSGVDLEFEARLLTATQRAVEGMYFHSQDMIFVSRFLGMFRQCMQDAAELCCQGAVASGEGTAAAPMTARRAITLAFANKMREENYEEDPEQRDPAGEETGNRAAQDLPGHRNAALMAHDALYSRACVARDAESTRFIWDNPDKKPAELARLAFADLFIARDESKEDIAIVSARSLPPWAVHFFGSERIASMVLPTKDHATRGHLVDLLENRQAPALFGCEELHDPRLAALAAQGKHLMVAAPISASEDDPCTVYLGARSELEAKRVELQRELRPFVLPQHAICSRDGAPYTISLDVDSPEVLAQLLESPGIPIGIVKTEFLLQYEARPGELIWEFSDTRLNHIYDTFLQKALKGRHVTLRLVDEVEESTSDKPSVPVELRDGYRERQIREIVRVAVAHERPVAIMVPNFKDANRDYRWVREVACQASRSAEHYVTIKPLVESPAGIEALGRLVRETSPAGIGIGFGDLSQQVMRTDSRDHPQLKYPPFPVLQAMRSVVSIAESCAAPVTLCGRRAGREEILLLCEAAGLRAVAVHPKVYQKAASFISMLDRETAVSFGEALKDCSNLTLREKLYGKYLEALRGR